MTKRLRGCECIPAGVAATVAVLALLLAVPGPAAAKKCVNPAGSGGCFSSIQAAIDAAGPGETVVVRPGHYREQIVVDKQVLLLGGGRQPGQVVLDGEQVGDTVTVTAAGVKLRNFTVWNSSGSLVAVGAAATGTTLSKMILRQSGGNCLNSAAAGTTVLGSSLRNCGSPGIDVAGDGFFMRGSSVLVAGGTCVQVTGGDARIIDNLLRACDDYGINLDGPGGSAALVSGNRVLHVTYEGIFVRSPNATVRRNRVDGTVDYGIEVDSTHPVIRGNTALNTGGGAFYIGCFVGCTGGEVVGNRALWSESTGFQLDFEGAALVRDNLARGLARYGFDLSDTGPYEARANTAQDTGSSAFFVASSVVGATLAGNVASSSYGDGFSVDGDNVTLQRNRARMAYIGFHLFGGASNATLEDNTALLDTYPFCDESPGATLPGGNNFSTSVCPP